MPLAGCVGLALPQLVDATAEDTMSYWVDFKDGTAACVEGESVLAAEDNAKSLTGKEVGRVRGLPYPALPQIGEKSPCPAFCYSPKVCAGRGCCPQRYACSE